METIKTAKRAEDLTSEEAERIRRSNTKFAKEVKTQMTQKEIKKLKKQGIVFKTKGVVVKGEMNLALGYGLGYNYR